MDGKNFVGRADDMDIQILGDNKIDRRNHAVIVFDAKKQENMLLPGDGLPHAICKDSKKALPASYHPVKIFLHLPAPYGLAASDITAAPRNRRTCCFPGTETDWYT